MSASFPQVWEKVLKHLSQTATTTLGTDRLRIKKECEDIVLIAGGLPAEQYTVKNPLWNSGLSSLKNLDATLKWSTNTLFSEKFDGKAMIAKAEQLKKSAQDFRNVFIRYKPFFSSKKVMNENAADAAFATWQATWERAALTEFEAGVIQAYKSNGSVSKKRNTSVCAAHTRLVEFWSGDPSKAVACLWVATQAALQWMEDNKKTKDKAEKKSKPFQM